MGAHADFVIDEPPIWIPLSIEGPYRHDRLSPFNSLLLTRVQCLSISGATIYLLIASKKSSLKG